MVLVTLKRPRRNRRRLRRRRRRRRRRQTGLLPSRLLRRGQHGRRRFVSRHLNRRDWSVFVGRALEGCVAMPVFHGSSVFPVKTELRGENFPTPIHFQRLYWLKVQSVRQSLPPCRACVSFDQCFDGRSERNSIAAAHFSFPPSDYSVARLERGE